MAPAWAVKDRLVGLIPIAGFTDSTGAEDGEINCVNVGISSTNLFIDRPLAFPFPEVEELLFPLTGAASGIVLVCTVPAAVNPAAVAGDGATLMVARGTAVPTLLFSDNGSLD